MPLYEFKCSCGRRREEFFLMEEDKSLDCDYCGQEMGRLFTAPAIRIDANAKRCTDRAPLAQDAILVCHDPMQIALNRVSDVMLDLGQQDNRHVVRDAVKHHGSAVFNTVA